MICTLLAIAVYYDSESVVVPIHEREREESLYKNERKKNSPCMIILDQHPPTGIKAHGYIYKKQDIFGPFFTM